MRRSQWPFWHRQLTERTVTFEFDAQQAAALANELRDVIDTDRYRQRLDELHHRLNFDADFLRRKSG